MGRVYKLKIIQKDNETGLSGEIYGEKINYNKHELCADVKAITLHKYKVEEINNEWKASFILDI